MAGAMEVSDVERRSQGPLRRLIQALRPDALKAVPLGQEIQDSSIRRPPRRRLNTCPVGHRYPFAFTRRYAVVKRRDENRTAALLCLHRHKESDPIAIGREMGSMDVVLRVANHVHFLARDDINRAVTNGLSRVVENSPSI